MLKTLFVLVSLLSTLYAGSISLSDTLVNFMDVPVGSTVNGRILLSNNGDIPVRVVYNAPLESSFDVQFSSLSLVPGTSMEISLSFSPKQNITYNDFLILRLSSGRENLVCRLRGNGRMPNSYYAPSFNKWGADLKKTLHTIIKGHTEYSYSKLWDILSDTDEDPANPNKVILFYTGWSYAKGNHGGDPSEWNREHVWAKSHGKFKNSAPAGTDVHHIRPTDVTVNSARGNLDFDDGGNLYTDGDGVTKCRYDNDSWEPRAAVKGDVARMMYYMTVRYEGDATAYDLELVENIPSSGGTFGRRSTLYAWQNADPVDDWERSRNEKIYTNWQHNRNPFIDYPQFIERLPSLSGKTLIYTDPTWVIPADSIVLQPVSPGNAQHFVINLANTGGGTLNIQSMQLSDNHFSLSIHHLVLAPESESAVTLTFIGDNNPGVYNDRLHIVSDDPQQGTLSIPVSVTVTMISAIDNSVKRPRAFVLGQNYPNPFNPVSVINYSLEKAGWVQMDIINVKGQRVRRLLDIYQSAGKYTIVFDGSNLPSGVYYYTLRTNGGHTQTRKMVLLK